MQPTSRPASIRQVVPSLVPADVGSSGLPSPVGATAPRASPPVGIRIPAIGVDSSLMQPDARPDGTLEVPSDFTVHSGLDTAASILAFIAVRTTAQPADRELPYGHGKAENLAAYTEGILLVIAGLIIGYEALQRLGHRGVVERTQSLSLSLPS